MLKSPKYGHIGKTIFQNVHITEKSSHKAHNTSFQRGLQTKPEVMSLTVLLSHRHEFQGILVGANTRENVVQAPGAKRCDTSTV